ncbi:meprin A subunit beta-like [Stylophora pistillata]|uniref:meprin A subunit beta-like n=1 Tax=Stylophora pistillata TaxID=50429 RepID=UPI000C053796|nr:meprin A subunit beta-like [Stylophora pistillata]
MKINHSSLILCLFGCHVKLYLVTAVYAIGQIEDGLDDYPKINSVRHRSKRNFIAFKRYWWDSKTIPYVLDKSLGTSGKKAFREAVKEFERETCLRFTPYADEKDYVWVHRGSGCSSATGRSGGKHTLSLGKGCHAKGVVIHELLHALGMMHEHCRADRNEFIRINMENIKPEARIEYRILNGFVNGEPYDYGSIMHYGFNFFSLDPKKPIIVKLMPGGKQMGQRKGFSGLDLRKINRFYNCTNYIKSMPAPQKKIIKIVSGYCDFERGFCNWENWINEEQDQFDWKLGTAVVKNRPGINLQHPLNLSFTGSFIFFEKPLHKPAEYMSSGVLASAGFFKGFNCLSFRYFMKSGGYLRVFTEEAESKENNPYVLIWERTGPQGDNWNKMEKTISGNLIKICIEGIKSPDQDGFVAIDDISVYQGETCVG